MYTFSLEIGNCPDCRKIDVCTTTVSEKEKIIAAHLYVNIKKHRYHILLHLEKNYFAINDLVPDGVNPLIIHQELIPNINVDNAIQKISTILLFL